MNTTAKIIYVTLTYLWVECFTLLPGVNAVSPRPDGCYPDFTTAEGCDALNTAIGLQAGNIATTGSGNVYLGAGPSGVAGESNHTCIANINATSVGGGDTDTVTVNLSTGLLGHLSSSRRYKEDIKPMDKSSEALFALKPVTYRYNKEIDKTQSLAFGLIAEEVAQVDQDLVAQNKQARTTRKRAL